jgi:hypothetical protein
MPSGKWEAAKAARRERRKAQGKYDDWQKRQEVAEQQRLRAQKAKEDDEMEAKRRKQERDRKKQAKRDRTLGQKAASKIHETVRGES